MTWTSLLLSLALLLRPALCQKDRTQLSDGEWKVEVYLDPPVKPAIHIYVFNLTNPDGFLKNGEKPIFDEVGPYVFRETWVRENLQDLGDTAKFTPKRIYKFRKNLSKGHLSDIITTINVPAIVSFDQVKNGDEVVKKAVTSLLEILKEEIYVTKNANELIWGYPNQLITLGKDVPSKYPKYPFDLFGLFIGNNDTDTGSLTIGTGRGGEHLGKILSWNESSTLDLWQPGTPCDTPSGSEGLVFKPNLQKTDTVQVFTRNICRGIPLEFKQEVTNDQGIKGYRFSPPRNTLGTLNSNPASSCYCTDGIKAGCSQIEGLFDMSECQYGSPIFLSWPHFLYADPHLLNDVVGLAPVEDKHQTFFDIEPKTGVTLRARMRAQINVKISKDENNKFTEGLRDMIFPLMWFSDESDGFEEDEDRQRFANIVNSS